jgi:UrcA family protein
MTMKTATRYTLLAVLICSFNAVAGAAEPGAEPAKRVVNFADLDLSRDTGITVLYARLRSAARMVCAPANERALESITPTRRCVEQAVKRAVADVNAPALTNYYLAKTGQSIILAERR